VAARKVLGCYPGPTVQKKIALFIKPICGEAKLNNKCAVVIYMLLLNRVLKRREY